MKRVLPLLLILCTLCINGKQIRPEEAINPVILREKIQQAQERNMLILNQIETKIKSYELSPKDIESLKKLDR
jgi:hypothetical protein